MVSPAQWRAAEGDRRSQTVVHFEYAALDGSRDPVACMAHNAIRRGVPRPAGILTALRLAEAERAAARASQETGCTCRFLGPVAEEEEPPAEPGATPASSAASPA